MRLLLSGAVLLLVGTVAAVLALQVDDVKWRSKVILSKIAGDIDDISWPELFRWIRPGSPVYLGGLAEEANPFAAIPNTFSTDTDRSAGSDLYAGHCSACHGASGYGATGPSLRAPKRGSSDWALFRVVQRGIAGKPMPPSGLAERDIWRVISYVRTFGNGEIDSIRAGPLAEARPVSTQRLETAGTDDGGWLLPNGSYDSKRFSPLKQITRDNVQGLTLSWAYQLNTPETVETTPLVNDGVMYFTEPSNSVVAVDATTGKQLWHYQHRLQSDIVYSFGVVNRGVALMNDAVFLATLDARVVALDARSGKVLWTTQAADPSIGYNFTSAPLAVDGKVIVGVAGGDHGNRGFIDAYDAQNGKRLWRFETIPHEGQTGNDTWGPGKAWLTGGAPAWGIGSYDKELNLLYWGTGNPAPDFDGDDRPGDNLYSNCVVALDADTGKLRWHFQFTPHDTHDWDSTQVPVLVNARLGDRDRKLLIWANRNAFYYVLDRETGEFIRAAAYAKQTWAEGITPSGRPIARADAEPSKEGTLVWPRDKGATNWWPPSFDPITQLLYVPTLEQPNLYFKVKQEFEKGKLFLGTLSKVPALNLAHTPSVRAIDALTGEVKFTHEFPRREGWSQVGGVLSTVGGLLFVGDFQTFYALDTKDGQQLWSVELGGGINAAPVTFAVRDRQFVSIAAGGTLFTFALPPAAAAQ